MKVENETVRTRFRSPEGARDNSRGKAKPRAARRVAKRRPRNTMTKRSDPERVAQRYMVRPFQGRILLPSCSVGGAHYVRSAPGYCLHPLRGYYARLLSTACAVLVLFASAFTVEAQRRPTKPVARVLFDDFSYSNRAQLARHGWIVRT